MVPLATVWGLEDLQGPPRGILDFVSGMYIPAGIISGQFNVSIDAFRHLILPAIALGTIPLAIIARITRSSLLEVLGQDFVRTARAKGLKERSVILRHATRNALLPVVTVIGLQLGALLSGAVLTETVFNLAGVGRTMFEAITGRDYVVDPGPHADHRPDLRDGEPHRRHLVRLPRSAGEGTMSTQEQIALAEATPVQATVPIATARPASLWRDTLGSSSASAPPVVGLLMLTFLVLVAIFAPVIATHDPYQSLLGVEPGVVKRSGPCIHILGCPASQPEHIFGTDGNFRDSTAASSTAPGSR